MRTTCISFALALALTACGDDATTDDTSSDTDTADTTLDSATDSGTTATDTIDTIDDSDDVEVIADSDEDGDGLSDAEEALIGTDPLLVDSDDDGYWDGWEHAAGSDPLDPLATPALALPHGTSYILDLVDIVEPVLLRSFLGNILDRWPPILIFVEPGADGAVTVTGGIAQRVSLGPDDAAGTDDDVYGLELGSLDPATGAFQVLLHGTRVDDALSATADEVVIDLSNISEIVRGVRLRVEDVTFSTTFEDDDARLEPTRLAGVLSRAGVEDILENADLPLPIDIETAMELLDPDGDGIIDVDIALKGRPAIAGDWVLTPKVEPVPRDPGACCPDGLSVGDAIDSALRIVDQGLQPSEEALAKRVIDQAFSHPERLDLIATQRVIDGERRTYVYSPRGNIYFVRERGLVEDAPRTTYRTVLLADRDALEGEAIAQDDARSPLANQDPTALSDYASFLAIGEAFLPNADYQALGYEAGDERLVRVPADKYPYPFAYERLSQIFDDPRTGDLVLQPVSYMGSRGDHGALSGLQSRSPLIVSGKGVIKAGAESGEGWSIACAGACGESSTPFLLRDEAAHIVDVAPTVAKALGVAPITGVGPDGFLADDVYLAWQDGRPLDLVLDGTSASRAIIIINDGLTSMELLHEALDAGFAVDAYRELMSRGVTYRHGAITNFPSNTYPSHNVVGSGAYSGHHGLVDNGFYEREVQSLFDPIVELFGTEKFVGGAHPGLPVETLHEAVARSFGGVWNKKDNAAGVLTASLNDPSTRGSGLATLERRIPEGYTVPDAMSSIVLGQTTWDYPEASFSEPEGILDNSTVTAAYGLFITNPAKSVPVPRYAVINFSATDGAGHKAGPHGDEERVRVLAATNKRLRILIEMLKQASLYDDTLIVLSADHGMELKDPNAQGDMLAGLSSDVALVRDHYFVYFKQLVASYTTLPATSGEVTFTVTDSDGGVPIAGATIVVKDGLSELATGTTDADGHATLTLALDGVASPVATITKTGFSLEAHPLTR